MKKILVVYIFLFSLLNANVENSNPDINKKISTDKIEKIEKDIRNNVTSNLEKTQDSFEKYTKKIIIEKEKKKEEMGRQYAKISKYLKIGQIIINTALVVIVSYVFYKKYKEYISKKGERK